MIGERGSLGEVPPQLADVWAWPGAGTVPDMISARARIRSTMHPDGFHGVGAAAPYFEGWYVKLVGADRAARRAVIPGVFKGQPGAGGHVIDEAFVQVLDGATGRSWYHRYDADEFTADPDRFDVRVGPNRFSGDGVRLDLPDGSLRGEVRFTTPLDPWPVSYRSPGVMGWYAWMPFMECYHGVCSFGHDLAGELELTGQRLDLARGRGYLEKDWGQAFPAGYVWMQSNHFSDPGTCLMGSIALIPWLTSEFRGFLVGLKHRGELLTFATYTGSKTTSLHIDDEHVRWSMRDRAGNRLELEAERRGGALLHAPIRTEMHKRVEETLDARIRLQLFDPRGRLALDDVGEVAGLEVHGDLPRLLATSGR